MSYYVKLRCPECGRVIPEKWRNGTDVECPNSQCRHLFDLAEVAT